MAAHHAPRLLALALAAAVSAAPLEAQTPDGEATDAAPLPEADGSSLSPVRMTYSTTVEVQGQRVDLDQTRTLRTSRHDGRDTWTVVEDSETEDGRGLDSLIVDRERLTPVRRYAVGQGTLEIVYSADSISGSLSYGENSVPVSEALEAPVLSGGPGLEVALSALPLEEGWSATVRSHAPQQQQVHTREFSVTGTGTIEVPAGRFEAYVVEAVPVEGAGHEATFWVRREAPHHVLRSVRSMPVQMGGGTATKELVSMEALDPSGAGRAVAGR